MKTIRFVGTCGRALALSVAALIGAHSLPAQTPNFTWSNIELGHGGHCDLLIPHPMQAGLLYGRSDVNGAYKMTAATGRWDNLLSQYFTSNSDTGRGGVAMAVNPKNANTLFIARHALHRSLDGGQTWSLRLNKHSGNKREHGEAIAVDPVNPQRVYYGTMTEGLWVSDNQGDSFVQVPAASIPFGDGNPGVTLVAVDGSSSVSGRAKNVYVDVFEVGLHWSNNGGSTWTKLTAVPTGIARVAISPSGIAYIARKAGGVYRFDPNTATVTNITPTGASAFEATAVTVRSGTEDVLLSLYSAGRKLYRANNPTAASSWTSLPHESMVKHQPWALLQYWSRLRAWFLASDPHEPARVYFGDDFALWESADVWTKGTSSAAPIVWESMPFGFENTVALDLQTPPTGTTVKLLAGMRDVSGFRITNPAAFPASIMGIAGTADDIVGLGISEQNANNVIALMPAKTSPYGHNVAYSSDGGLNWAIRGQAFASNVNPKTTGKIAMSATNSSKLVAVAYNQVPRYSADGGVSWNNAAGLPTGTPIRWPGLDWCSYPVDNDKVAADTFYLHYYNATGFYRSTNGGQNWTKVNTTLPASGSSTMMVENSVRAVPGRSGEVWVALRSNGLWRSIDGGTAFTQIAGFNDARLIAFGAPAAGSSNPTCYVHGKRGTDLAVYLSKDNGVSWEKVLKPTDPQLGQTVSMSASRTEFGKVYVGTRGLGLFQGVAGGTATVPQPTNPGFEQDMLGWSTSGTHPGADFTEQGGAYAGTRRLVHWNSAAFQVSTYQTVAGIPNGTYAVSVQTKSSAWGTERIFVSGHGGSQLFANIPRNTGAWTKVTVPGVVVTSGQLTITLSSSETSGAWIYYDDMRIEATP